MVPIVPDESRTFGMEGMFRQLAIWSSVGQLYTPQDADQLMFYKEDKHGQILQEGINEPGAMSSWIAAATSYSNHGVSMIPFYIYYSMFGFQRVGDLAWAAGDQRARGFMLGGTSGRTTLNGEGLQHEDGHSHILSSTIPNCISYDPTYAYEVAVIIQDGLRRMFKEQEDVFYYITLLNENYVQPAMPKGVEEGILKGMYRLSEGKGKKDAPRVQLLGSGAILREVVAAQDLLEKGSAVPQILDFLRACIEGRLNVLISGGTGSGKTTFLNILSSYIPERERIVTIEDSAELFLNQPHVVRLESRPANIEGRGEITIRDLVRNSLRMRPDRIIVGECRGGEALDMLQAMNTGHDGSLTTAHANSPRDALARMETMVLMAGFDLPVRAIREQIASAVDLIVQTARMRDGSRKIIAVSEIVGMEGDVVTMQEIIRFQQHGVDKDSKVAGEFQYTGVQPQCMRRFDEYGIEYDVRSLSTLASTGALW